MYNGVRTNKIVHYFLYHFIPYSYGDHGHKYSPDSLRSVKNPLKEALKSVHFGGIDCSCGYFSDTMIYRLG